MDHLWQVWIVEQMGLVSIYLTWIHLSSIIFEIEGRKSVMSISDGPKSAVSILTNYSESCTDDQMIFLFVLVIL